MISERNGKSLRAGRKTRAVPPALRRALRVRDHGCRFPGCNNYRFVDTHHIQHWVRGGATRLDNLVLLCRGHHRLIHEGGYAVDERLHFYDPWGWRIPHVWPAPRGDPARLRGDDIGPDTIAGGNGDPMDLSLTVDTMLSFGARGSPALRAS